jgi:hypothetical protein
MPKKEICNMLEDLLFEKYAKYGLKTSSEIYLPLGTSRMFVEECSSFKVAIVGLEFFHIKPGMIVPVAPINSLDCSVFLSKYEEWDKVVKNCNEAALKVLHLEEKKDHTQYYHPTLFENSEWR